MGSSLSTDTRAILDVVSGRVDAAPLYNAYQLGGHSTQFERFCRDLNKAITQSAVKSVQTDFRLLLKKTGNVGEYLDTNTSIETMADKAIRMLGQDCQPLELEFVSILDNFGYL